MPWGTFTPQHIATLLLSVAVIVGLHFFLRSRTERVQTAVLFVLSFAGIAAIVFNLLMWDSPIEYLPLHMCSVNALLLPATVLSKNRVLGSLTLLWCLGAALALIVNTGQADFVIPSATFFFFYIPHTLEIAVPVLLFTTGLIRFDFRATPITVAVTMGIYTLVHFANRWLNRYAEDNQTLDWQGEIAELNYMFSLSPEGNPLLELFWDFIPFSYWYMFGAIPLIVLYLGLIWCITRFAARLKRRNANKLATVE
jgi:uncharacterized membrane protein YwaF